MGFGIASAGHHKETLPLSTANILWVWALQGYVAMGTAGILGGWALQGHLVVGHCKDALRLGSAVRLRAEGEDNIDFII